jgi:MerR family transcriptional regulator, redox-sensitive transcriptional activator SoxR
VPNLLSIGELAKRTELRTSALRYYEAAGLLDPATRVSGRRQYEESAVARVSVIQFAQRLGFTLSEIRLLLSEPRGRRQKERWRGFVDTKVDELDEAMTQMRSMKTVLIASRDCDCVDVHECARLCAS